MQRVVADGPAGISVFHASEYRLWLDNAAGLPGLFGSRWKTDVVARNAGVLTASVEINLHSTDGVFTLFGSVAPGEQQAFAGVFGLMNHEGKGCLEVNSDAPIQVSGRIFNQTEDGTYGQYVEAYESSQGLDTGESAMLLQLRQIRRAYRTNLSITNTGDEPAEVVVRLFNSGGDELHEYTLEIGAKSLLQDSQPFRHRAGQLDLGWGFAELEVLRGSGILASASVVDSQTNDATTIPFTR